MIKTQTVERIGPLTPRDHAAASHPVTICTEWTPAPTVTIPIRSTWRDATGPLLTNRRINARACEGWYGETAKVRALAKDASRTPTTGIVFRCTCGSANGLRFYRWSYLPKPGYYCSVCVASHRGNAEREKQASKELAARVQRAIMERYV
jgi:hypothetical protein